MQQGRILIVDDQQQGRDVLEMVLNSEGYQLDFAESGPEALAKARAEIPDLVLLDVMMPGMNGYETCRRFREDPLLAEVPIIFVTALSDRRDRLEGLNKGADDYVTKPVNRHELRIRTRNILHLNRYRKLIQERARLDWVMEEVEEPYLLIGHQGRIQYANPAARRYLYLDESGPLPAADFIDLARHYYRCEPAVAWEDWPNPYAEVPRYLVRAETASSSALWLQVKSFDPPQGVHEGILLCLHEVSETVERYQRTWCFQGIVSHKLGTPLSILSYLEMLMPKLREVLGERDLEMMELVQRGAQRLSGQINEILHYVNMPFSSEYEYLSIQAIGEIIAQIRQQLDISADFSITPEAEKISLALTNTAMHAVLRELLINAKRFHPLHSPQVQISIETHASPRSVILRVSDDGGYLPAEVLKKVWVPYFQHEKYFTGESPGMGLGLPSIASIMWRLGGTCRLLNRPDKPGIIVELQFPAGK